jgi:hypothetical protein
VAARRGESRGKNGQNERKAENVCSIGCPLVFSENFLSSAANFQARYQLKTFFFVFFLSILVFEEDFPDNFAPK